jgi:hypothetical protein
MKVEAKKKLPSVCGLYGGCARAAPLGLASGSWLRGTLNLFISLSLAQHLNIEAVLNASLW